MRHGPLVSVLMTAFNREEFIAESIESVIALWYQDWELIIVDDCSMDRTLEIAQSYEKKDSRIHVYQNDKNLGDYPNRNKAASYAKGKYIKYVDADDLIYPHGLSVMVYSIEKYPEAGCALAFPSSDFKIYPCILSPEEIYKENFFSQSFFFNSPLGAIINRELFYEVGQFLEEKHIGDEDLWMKIALKYPIVKMVKGTAHWRNHSLQQNKIGKKKLELKTKRYFLPIKYLDNKNCPLDKTLKRTAVRRYKYKYIRSTIIAQYLLKFKFRTTFYLIRKCHLSFFDFLISCLPNLIFKIIFLRNKF